MYSDMHRENGLQMLKNQLPLVRDDDSEVSIFGKGTPNIYINNRLINNTNELRQLKSNEIKKVEVVTTPGAEYNSSVRSVIKIYPKPHQGEGLSGNIDADATLYRRFSEYANTHLNYRYKSMDIFFTGDIFDSRLNYDSKNRYVTSSIASLYNGKKRINKKEGNLGGGINYMPNENQSAGFRYNWYRMPTSTIYNNSAVNQSDGAVYTTEAQALSPSWQNYMNAYYSGKFNQFRIDFNTDYSSGKTKEHSATNELKTDDNHLIAYNAESDYKIAASKLTMTYTRVRYDIVWGGEYNYTTRKEGQTILSNTEENDLPTTDNKVNQQLWAAFATYDLQLGAWYFSGGIRFENTSFDYYEEGKRIAEQSKRYHNFFPVLIAGFSGNNIQWELNFRRYIDRPSYGNLSNVISYQTDNVRNAGNPFLVPEMSSTLSFSFSLNHTWDLYLQYDHMGKSIARVNLPYQNRTDIMVIKPVNLPDYNRYMAIVSFNQTIAFWYPCVDVRIQGQDLKYSSPERTYNKPVVFVQFQNAFNWKHDWLATVNWRYQSKSEGGVIRNTKSVLHLDVSLSKYFLHKALQLQLSVRDLFNQGYSHLNTTTNGLSTYLDEDGNSRRFRFSVSYYFNKTNKRYKGQSAADSELNRM